MKFLTAQIARCIVYNAQVLPLCLHAYSALHGLNMVSHNISVRYSGIEVAKSYIRLLHLLNLTNKHNRRLDIKETTLSTMNPTTTAQRPFLPEAL